MGKWILLAAVLLGSLAGVASADAIRVSAAISLKEAVTEIAKEYQADGGGEVTFVFGSSGQLAAQIKNGAEVDVLISAAGKQVDDLVKEGLAEEKTRQVVAGNALVMVVPGDAKDSPTSIADLAGGSVKKVAMGDPKTVPAGDYAMQTLKALKIEEKVRDRIVYGANVRQVLSYVERGEVDAGLVYATDAKESGKKVKVVETAGPGLHQPIVYPAVVVKASKQQEEAAKFLAYMKGEKAKKILTERGFTLPAATTTTAPAK